MAHQPDLRLRERAGLVGAERVHGAEVVDRRQPLGNDAEASKPQRTACQRDGDDHRQQLGREAHCEREREHDRLEPGPLEEHVGRQHEQHEEEGHAQDQEPEPAHPDLESIRWPAVGKLGGEGADARLFPRPARDRGSGAADDGSSHEDEIGFLVGLRDLAGKIAGMLLGRVRLSRQQRLIDEEVARGDQPCIRRDDVAGREPHDVARHQLLEMQLALAPVANDERLRRHRAAQRIDRVLRADLLHEVEDHAERHDDDDDDEACRVAGESRESAREQQDQNERIEEAQKELHRERVPLVRERIVGAAPLEPRHRIRFGQADARGFEIAEQPVEGDARQRGGRARRHRLPNAS